jgi:hypothetical protein
MRYLLKANIPAEDGNKAIKNGSLGKNMKEIISELKPEAVYFSPENGQRTAYMIVNFNDASDIVRIAEPFFLAFNAEVQLTPVMTPEGLDKGFRNLETIVSKYAQR